MSCVYSAEPQEVEPRAEETPEKPVVEGEEAPADETEQQEAPVEEVKVCAFCHKLMLL